MEVRQMIFKMLPPKDLANCRLICRQTNHQIQEDFMLMRIIWSRVPTQTCMDEAENGNIDFFAALTEFATDPNPTSNARGKTPLHYAAEEGHLEVCQLLLERCEDKNPADGDGWTPLHEAADGGHLEVCCLILEKCDDKNPPGKDGVTPLHLAAQEGELEVCRLILEKCEDEYGTDNMDEYTNPADEYGQTPLHNLAAQVWPLHRGMAPLHIASRTGQLEVFRLILERCEDKNPADDSGQTPLHIAAERGCLDLCGLILERCGDKSPTDEDGETPLELASRRGHHKIVELIQSYL